MSQAKLVKRGTVPPQKPEQPPQPALPAVKTLRKSLMERVKSAETSRDHARMAFEALFAPRLTQA